MEHYIIKGGNPLVGDVTIGGAKNAALGILAASIMTDEDVLIDNLPDVHDSTPSGRSRRGGQRVLDPVCFCLLESERDVVRVSTVIGSNRFVS